MRLRFSAVFIAIALALAALAAFSMCTGSLKLGFWEVLSVLSGMGGSETASAAVFHIRLPRLAAGALVGASLASAGAAMQSLFRNPLADPSITGVSSGAALGAALSVCVFSSALLPIQAGAMVFGIAAAAAIWRLGRINGRVSAFSMLLAGIAVNAFCGALVGFAMYSAREAGLKGFIFWTLGSLDNCSWGGIALSAAISCAAWGVLMANARGLNMLLLGREGAYHSGADADRLQFLAMFCAAALTAASVSICGIIGFVGLVVPHMARLASGPDNRRLLPLCALGGACLVTFSDLASRLLTPGDNVPIGVVTALIGAPFFMFLLRRARNA